MLEEQEILKTGRKLFGSLTKPQKRLFSKKWWYENIMKWVMSSPTLKTPLFRFVDVFPSLKKKADISFYFNEYFRDGFYSKSQKLPIILNKGVSFLPSPLLSIFISKQMKEMARLFIVGEELDSILPILEQMRGKDSAFTLDLLGEATLSETEAKMYQNNYLKIMDQLYFRAKKWEKNSLIDEGQKGENLPLVNISIKSTSLDSQIFTVAWENSKEKLKNKLRPLFQKAVDTNTFLNIDMEQYAYKALTLKVFKELVSEEEFKQYPHFGIVVQAYLKESFNDLQDIVQFSETHPAPITVRLVKGAYWDYELIHARQQNWPCPVFLNKWESDINFEVCTELILKAYPRLRLAVGSHNIRSIAFALSLVEKMDIPKKAVEVQALYGMANSIVNCLIQNGWRVRQYCPVGAPIPGMAYLVRRLLENTSNESFLRSWQYENQTIENMLKTPKVS